jgi:hypothetical protein
LKTIYQMEVINQVNRNDEGMTMKWSRELPKVDGWYWLRNRDIDGSHNKPWPIEIIMGQVYENDELIDWSLDFVEFQPIQPPEE